MFSENDPGDHDYAGNSNSSQLLREIEAISNALYLRKPPRKALLLPSGQQHHTASRTRFYETKAKPNQEFRREDEPDKEGKMSTAWNWKKPLKSLAHIGHRKFSCLFSLHVHSIDGLPPHFSAASLRVNWKRKDDISQTRASTVLDGMAEFNESLILKCTIYGGRSGPNHLIKYEPELFMIYVSVNGVPRLDIGKHLVDVTRLLSPTLEEIEREKSLSRWTTSFKLFGKANGAFLHVSFGIFMMKNGLVNRGHLEVPKLLNLIQNRPSIAEMAQPVTAHSSNKKICRESSELSESIDFLYQKLDEGDFCGSSLLDFDSLKQMYSESDPGFESEKETEFTVVDCGIEIDNAKVCNFDEATDTVVDKKMEHCSMKNIRSNCVDEVEKDENSLLVTKSILLRRASSLGEVKLVQQDNLANMGANHQESIMPKDLSSLDDVNESVISDFLGRLGLESGSSRFHPESPRELLLRQFEKETMASCNSMFYWDAPEERPNYGRCDLPLPGRGKYNESFDFAPSLRIREDHKSASQLRRRRKAQFLENLETETLMQTWGIKEKDFQYSPRNCPGGFGSPIELPVEHSRKSPSLDEGCGSLVLLKGGGFFRSMNPALFKDSRNEGRLSIQLSHLVVLPAEMGSHFMEILQRFSSIGADKLYMQVNRLMSLEDLNGQIESSIAVGYERKSQFEDDDIRLDHISPKDLIHLAIDKIEVLSLEGLKIQSNMSKEEAPSRLGLSSNLKSSSKNYIVRDLQCSSSDVVGLMDLSIPLEEWSKLDAGIIGDDNNNHESVVKILATHHAKSSATRDMKIVAELMGNNLTLALMLQLKDPLRNLEPVGRPMLCLIQVERVDRHEEKDLVSVKDDRGEGSFKYTINGIHLLGVNSEPGTEHVWGTTAQQVSGTRWLLANGIGKTFRRLHSKTRSNLGSSSTPMKMKQKDVLWSVSSHVNGKRSIREEIIFGDSHVRNPDLIFQNIRTA